MSSMETSNFTSSLWPACIHSHSANGLEIHPGSENYWRILKQQYFLAIKMHFELAVLKCFSLCFTLCVNISAEINEDICMSEDMDLLTALVLQTCLVLFLRTGTLVSAGR